MNRLAVYSYLTRYPYGCTWFGRMFTVLLPEKYLVLVFGSVPIESSVSSDPLNRGQSNSAGGRRQPSRQAGRQDRFPRIWRRAGYSPSQIIISYDVPGRDGCLDNWTPGQTGQLDRLDYWTHGQTGQLDRLDTWTDLITGQLDRMDKWIAGQTGRLDRLDSWTDWTTITYSGLISSCFS